MAKKSLPCPTLLRQLLAYDPETGLFMWMPRADGLPRWNTRWANKPALTATMATGYRCGNINGRLHYAHRVAWAYHHGEWPDQEIDHINGDRRDNRILNLRSVSPSVNNTNKAKMTNNTSGTCGVYFDKRRKKWHARINLNGQTFDIGHFANLCDATEARKKAEVSMGFHANHGR